MISASSMHEAGHSKPVLWDNPGDGMEGGGRGVQDENIEISSIAVNEKKKILFSWKINPEVYPPLKIMYLGNKAILLQSICFYNGKISNKLQTLDIQRVFSIKSILF